MRSLFQNRGFYLIVTFLIVHLSGICQQDLTNPRLFNDGANGSRTYNASATGNSFCPNTYEFIPFGYDPNNKSVKYPLIISLPGLSEMLQQNEDPSDAAKRLVEQNYYMNAGVHVFVENEDFNPSNVQASTGSSQFVVVGLQCLKDAFDNTLDIPTQIDNVLTSYIINSKFKDKIDLNRIYMVGTSRGGGLIWEYLEDANRAKKIAAVALMAGGTDIWDVSKPAYSARFEKVIANILDNPRLGIYAAHNLTDGTVPYKVSETFINRLNADWPGRAVLKQYTTGTDQHNIWLDALRTDKTFYFGYNVYQWMLTYSLAAVSILPVTLTTFEAVAKSNTVELTWSTASESNSSYFAVERSSNGREFKEIGRVKSSGNSTTTKRYSFTDNAPLTGKNYYRLKMVDLDATFKFSEVRTVNLNGSDLEFSFGPNPVQGEASIRISGTQRARLTITVTDLMGRTLKSMNFTKSENLFTQKINLADLPAGQYVLSIKGENISFTQRIMKR